jgi:glucosyl-3-phosphoglycerate synthase
MMNWWIKRRKSSDARDLSGHIQRWLAQNTYHHSQFVDLRKLVAEKERQGLRISLCLPTLNEEKTIGKEVVLFRSELMQRFPLLDEIAVVDSGSTDRTREVASAFGADVYLARDILPEVGEQRGKGENLWKAIYQLNGDIIVYVDTDISNVRPHFVYGLVAPLLFSPETLYVKAFYDRPLRTAAGISPTGGGRVTEILVRPLFSLYFPELTALIQPLSGEYAARRSALEQIPFPVGYGVETAHLLDIYQRWGLSALAQTDLGLRIHRNQATTALGRMAFGILQTFFKRLPTRGRRRGAEDFQELLRQFTSRDGRYEQVETLVHEVERPPMITVPAYQQKFNREP